MNTTVTKIHRNNSELDNQLDHSPWDLANARESTRCFSAGVSSAGSKLIEGLNQLRFIRSSCWGINIIATGKTRQHGIKVLKWSRSNAGTILFISRTVNYRAAPLPRVNLGINYPKHLSFHLHVRFPLENLARTNIRGREGMSHYFFHLDTAHLKATGTADKTNCKYTTTRINAVSTVPIAPLFLTIATVAPTASAHLKIHWIPILLRIYENRSGLWIRA